MNKILLFHQFLGGNKKPNFIIQYYATKQIPFLFGKLKKFYTRSSYGNEAFDKGELIYDEYNEDTNIGEYGLYLNDIVNFYGGFVDKNDRNATIMGCIDLCYDLNDTNDYINIIDEDITIILPNSVEHLLGPVSSGGKVILDSLPENLKSIGNYGLHLLKGNGLVIPPSVTNIGKCFDISNGSVMIDNLYFLTNTPPTLTEGDLGFDGDTFHEDIELQICIPMEYKEEYLNSDFKIHERRLNVNRIIQNTTNIKIDNIYKTLDDFILSTEDITKITIENHSKYNNNICLNLPYSLNTIRYNMKTERWKSTASNKIIINSDIENVEKGRTSDSLFKDYGHVEFSEHCTYIPELLIDNIFSYGKQRSGLATNNLIYTQILTVGENIKDIHTTFKYGSSYGDDSNNTAGVMVFFKGGLKQIANMNFHKPLVDGKYNSKQVLVSYTIEEPNYNADLIFTIPKNLDFRNQNITKINDFAFYNIYFRRTSRFTIHLPKELICIGEKSLYFSDYQKSSFSVEDVNYYGTIDDWFKVETKGDMFGIDGNIYDTNSFAVKSSNNVSYPDINNGFIVSENVEIFNKNLNGYKSLSSITINSKIINANTLDKCNSLRNITLGTNVNEIKGQFTKSDNIICTYLGTINDYYKIKGFDLHLGSMLKTKDHENNDTFSVRFDNTITEIDNRLQYKSGGTSLIISESIETIHEYAFNSWSPQYITIYADIINQFKSTTLKYTDIQYLNLGTNITNITNIFKDCTNLTSITYYGTIEQWNAITKAEDWNENIPATVVTCSDGTVTIRETT